MSNNMYIVLLVNLNLCTHFWWKTVFMQCTFIVEMCYRWGTGCTPFVRAFPLRRMDDIGHDRRVRANVASLLQGLSVSFTFVTRYLEIEQQQQQQTFEWHTQHIPPLHALTTPNQAPASEWQFTQEGCIVESTATPTNVKLFGFSFAILLLQPPELLLHSAHALLNEAAADLKALIFGAEF